MNVFPGKKAFQLKDQCGLPLSVTFSELERRGIMMDWVGLMQAARGHGWWDYQTMDAVSEAFADSQSWPEKREGIRLRMMKWIMENPHPCMA